MSVCRVCGCFSTEWCFCAERKKEVERLNDDIRRGLLNIIDCDKAPGCCRESAKAILSLYEKECGVWG